MAKGYKPPKAGDDLDKAIVKHPLRAGGIEPVRRYGSTRAGELKKRNDHKAARLTKADEIVPNSMTAPDIVPTTKCTAISKTKKVRLLKAMLAELRIDVPTKDEDGEFFPAWKVYALARGNGIDTNEIIVTTHPEIRCGKDAIPGGTVCKSHGGNNERTIKAAKLRIAQMVWPALKRAEKIIRYGKQDGPAVAMIRDVFDRAGLGVEYDKDENTPAIANLAMLNDGELQQLLELYRKMNMPIIDITAQEPMKQIKSINSDTGETEENSNAKVLV